MAKTKAPHEDPAVILQRETQAADQLKAELQDTFKRELEANPDDADIWQTIADTIEGATDVTESIGVCLDYVNDSQMMCDGIDAAIKKLRGRKERHSGIIEHLRGCMHMALMASGRKSIPYPTGTVGWQNVRAAVLVDDESKVPATFFKTVDPVLDKSALNKAVLERHKALQALADEDKAREHPDPAAYALALAALDLTHPPVPGVHIEEGGTALVIR